MTANATRLTVRATMEPSRTGSSTMQPASQLRAFVDALDRLGYDVATLLAQLALRRADLDDPDGMVPCAATGDIVAGAMAERPMSNLPARMAQVTPIGSFPLLDYLVITCDTVGGALEQLTRWLHLTGAPFGLVRQDEADVVRLVIEPGDDAFAAQYETSLTVHHLRAESGGRLPVLGVSLMSAPDDLPGLQRLLGCAVRAPAPWSGIELPRDSLRLPLRRREPALRRVLEGHAATLAPPSEGMAATLSARVRGALSARLDRGIPPIRVIARDLSMSTRTLQRRLAAEGLSYDDLGDDVRRAAAERLLADASLSVGEVGYLLGFSEPSAFHRAFRRWHDLTPAAFRARMRPS